MSVFLASARATVARLVLRSATLAVLLGATEVAVALPAPAAPPAATSVSRTPPAGYAERATALITPFAAVLAGAGTRFETDAGAEVLIDETIHLVEPDGRVLRVRQVAYRAVTEAGVKALAEDLFEYDRDQQDFHLVRAVALDPDGTEHAVAPDAILVQSPQRRADLAIYDDTTEVRIIYPRVRVGGVTHAITVVQDRAARLPGAYTYRRIWGGGWPQFIDRHVVELPAALAPRLGAFTLGPGVPEPVRHPLPDGAVRLEWRGEKIPSRRSEISRAPTAQTGPVLHLTTLKDWDEVAAWYQTLLAGRDTLPLELATLADEWLRDAPDRDAKIAALFSKVADEVRYTSLSLGEGDYQPRSPSEVWTRRHGDCKDKSNLLVALLRHAGVPAHLALLNTRHLGLVDRRAPDYRVFDHAIVAVANPAADGGYTFLDPTIACATPDILAPSDADREVLVVREGRADWARTPPRSAGRIDYAFDLSLSPAGELSGWFNLSADGIYGAWERQRYRDLDTPDRRDNLARTVRGFFPGAEVVDVVAPDATARSGPAVARAYFLVRPGNDATGGSTALRFPSSRSLFLDLGTSEQRETAYFIYRDEISLRATFTLPAGASPGALPAPFQVETPTGRGGARWIAEPGRLRAELDLALVQSTIPPREFPRFYQAMLAFEGWLARPVSLGSDASAAAPAAVSADQIDLPLMPTGSGQLELVEKRYPFGGDHALRRAALLRTVQYFPNDAPTVYAAGVYLAILDWNEDKNQETVDRVTALLAAHRHAVTPGNIAWGESLRALALRDLGRADEAVEIFARIARDPNLGAWRRSQDALNAARLLEPRDPAAAAALLLECAPLVSEKQLPVLVALSRLLIRLDRDAELRECLASIDRAQPAGFDGILAHLTTDALDADAAHLARWRVVAEALAPAPGPELAAALARADDAARVATAAAAIQDRLRSALARPPLAEWLAASPVAKPDSWEDYESRRKLLAEKNEADACVRLGVTALLALPVGPETVARVWTVTNDADWQERRAGVAAAYAPLPLLLDLADLAPSTHDTRLECRFLRAQYLTRRGDHAAVRALFESLFAEPGFPSSYHLTAHVRLGEACEQLGDLAAALAATRALEQDLADSERNTDRVLRAVLINLHLGQTDEALRLVALLETVPEKTLLKTTNEYFIREFIELRRAGHAEAFWGEYTSWWPTWETLATALRLPPAGRETSVPVIPELSVLGQNLRQAERAKDNAAYWREFRTLVSASRWLPSLAPEVSGLAAQAMRIAPERRADIGRLVLAQLRVPGFPAENIRLRGFHVAATHYDLRDQPAALAAVAAYRAAGHPPDDPLTQAVNRIWALSARASGRELAEASAALEQDLADANLSTQRPLTVELLADLYRSRRMVGEESGLLERELGNAHIVADVKAHERLSERKVQLGGSVRLAEGVREWLRANPLPWLDHAAPASLDDPRLRDVVAVLENPERQFSAGEIIKLRLLAAQNPALGLATQSDALRQAVESLHETSPTHAEATRIADSFIDNPAFEESIRALFLWHLVLDAYNHERFEEFDRWQKHPLAARYNQLQQDFVAGLARTRALDTSDPAALSAFADSLLAAELGELEVAQLQEIFAHYIRLDDFTRARTLAASTPEWRFSSSYTGSRESNSLRFTRTLSAAEAQAPVHRALVERVRQHFPALPAEAPASYLALRTGTGVLPEMDAPSTRAAGLWMIGAGRFTRQDFEFWEHFIESLHHDPATRPLALDLIEVAVKTAPDDDTRAALLFDLFHTVDLDHAATRARLLAIVAPYADPAAHPQCEQFVATQKFMIALRLDEPVDLDAGLRAIRDPELGFLRAHIALRRHLQRDDVASIKRTLRGLDATLLLHPFVLSDSVPALVRVGPAAEHRLAREAAERELRSAILSSWLTGNAALVDHALDLAETLGSPDLLPAAWVDSMQTRCPHPMFRGRARVTAAWIRSDWETAAREAVAVLKDYPTFYRFHWYAGAALHRAGRAAEARPYLQTYADHSKDEVEYPAALALLAGAQPAQPK